jgi:hypothetical protein
LIFILIKALFKAPQDSKTSTLLAQFKKRSLSLLKEILERKKAGENHQPVSHQYSLVRIEFVFVFPFVLDQVRIVFTIVRILLFPDRMHPAPVLAIAVSMIDLTVAFLDEASAEFGYAIGRTNVYVKSVEVMGNTVSSFRNT